MSISTYAELQTAVANWLVRGEVRQHQFVNGAVDLSFENAPGNDKSPYRPFHLNIAGG